MSTPRLVLHTEGLAVLSVSLWAFIQLDGPWLWFAVLILSPDLFLLGYLINPRAGAALYNLVHTYLGPVAVLAVLWLVDRSDLAWLPLIWTAHIGGDRLAGFGLKYPAAFKDTHLQRL